MSKNKKHAMWKLLGIALIVSLSGCAAACHKYAGCSIPYRYCAPSPLPYVTYDGCHCPTPGATLYFQQNGVSVADCQTPSVPIATPAPLQQSDTTVRTSE
jgi:hypothetical protein